MGLSEDFIKNEIERENILSDSQLYKCGRQVPENWNEIKTAYLEVMSNPSKYELKDDTKKKIS